MKTTELLEKVSRIVQKISGTENIPVKLDLFEAGFLDSLGLIRLLVEIDQDLNIRIPITEIDRTCFNSINSITLFLQDKISQ